MSKKYDVRYDVKVKYLLSLRTYLPYVLLRICLRYQKIRTKKMKKKGNRLLNYYFLLINSYKNTCYETCEMKTKTQSKCISYIL